MKIVQQHQDTATGILFGMVGGIGKFWLLNVDATFAEKLFEAVITALLCGAAGVIGKEIVVFFKKKLKKR